MARFSDGPAVVVPRVPRYRCAFCQEDATEQAPGDSSYRCDRHAFAPDLPEPEVSGDVPRRRPTFVAILVITILAEAVILLAAIEAARVLGFGPAPTWLAAALSVLAALAAFVPTVLIDRIEERWR